jgi:hypothetical protein
VAQARDFKSTNRFSNKLGSFPLLAVDRRLLGFGLLYVTAVALLFASRVREFADETDNLLGGLLLTRGEHLYVDYFSSHMPFAYYLSAIPARLGATSLDQFRLFSELLLVGATLVVVWAFRHSLPLQLLAVWATLTIFAHTLQWGEMLTASTLAGYGILAAGLLFYTTPSLRFTPSQLVGLSLAMFVAAQSELVAVFPLLLLGACYVGMRIYEVITRETTLKEACRLTAITVLAIAVPHLLVVLAFWLSGGLSRFVYDTYQFNAAEYSQFVMNSTVLGILHDWEAQYRAYVLQSLQDVSGVQVCLILANFLATCVVFRSRGLLVAALYYLFIALTHVRNEGAYYLCSYFSLALCITFAVDAARTRRGVGQTLIAALAVLISLDFVVQVARTYDLSRRPIESPDAQIVTSLTRANERIFVAPYDPYVYLASERMPASRFSFYFPWQAIDPEFEHELVSDLRDAQPPIVIFRGDELVNGKWRAGQYGAQLADFLASEGYQPLDASSPVLANVLVRQDRVAAARQQLQIAAASPKPVDPGAAQNQ